MANSKAKGNLGEYIFADKLTAIFGRNFKRSTSGSGAMFGGQNFGIKLKGRDTSQVLAGLGDLVPPTGFYVVSETKNYADLDFHNVLKGKYTIIWDWIEEVRHDARFSKETEDVHLPHWLLFKITRRGEFACLPAKFFHHIFEGTTIPISFFTHLHTKEVPDSEGVKSKVYVEKYYIFNFDHLELIKEEVKAVIADPKYFKDDVLTLEL